MNTELDYRLFEHRQEGFDQFYRFHCLTNDYSPDIAVETWMADDMDFDWEKRCVMALFHGATYAGPCESMFADRFPVMTADVQPQIEFFQEHKSRLLFSPDCRYRKIVFERFLASVGESIKPYGTLGRFIQSCFTSADFRINYARLKLRCQKEWFHWGRMGHWCFTEALTRFIKAPILPPSMEFKEGKSHRSGWAFCIGRDDLTGDSVSKEDCQMLEQSARDYIDGLQNVENAGFLSLETACCNYKRQHMGSRYGGCYIDEQYAETMLMQENWPEYSWLWDKYLEGRQAVIPHSLLFENSRYANMRHIEAYDASWNKVLKDYGRMPRVEAWSNDELQDWGRIIYA